MLGNVPRDTPVQLALALKREVHDKIIIVPKRRKIKPRRALQTNIPQPATSDIICCKDTLPLPPKMTRRQVDKEVVLSTYTERFRDALTSEIVTTKQGERIKSYANKHPTHHQLVKNCTMRPDLDREYRVENLHLRDVAVLLVKTCPWFEDDNTIQILSCVNKKWNKMVRETLRVQSIDVRPLLFPRLDYTSHTRIDPKHVDLATALLVKSNMHPGMAIRYVQNELTGEGRDYECRAVSKYALSQDLVHMKRILKTGCPKKLKFAEPTDNKMKMLERGNQKQFELEVEIVDKTLTKEWKFGHMYSADEWVCEFSPYLRHTPQVLVLKDGSNPRMAWDGSTMKSADDIVLNDVSEIELEAIITFGDAKIKLYIHIFNTRVSFPFDEILLALADIKACFRYPRIHADMAGAFGFVARGMYHLATSMVFGSLFSAPSWEPFRRTIERASEALFHEDGLVEKHREYLDMISWAPACAADQVFVAAKGCELNPGVLNKDGTLLPPKTNIYVDDALLATIGQENMEKVLAAIIEAIFLVMGEPNVKVRQCPLAMDKWHDLTVSHAQVMLGLVINTRSMTVGITPEYQESLRVLIVKKWSYKRPTFKIGDIQKLVGKLARLGEGAHWIFKLMSHLYASLAFALMQNTRLLTECSEDFCELLEKIRTKRFTGKPSYVAKQVNFAIKTACRMTHKAKFEYKINETMREELDFFRQALAKDSGIKFESYIGFLIPRTPFGQMFGDSSLRACGGFCIPLSFWWHLSFPDNIVKQTLLYLDNGKDERFVSINCLEYLTVIINYCGALTALAEKPLDDPFPIILSVTDSKSALTWTLHTSKRSLISRALARFFCGLLIDSPLGINSKWIATDENEIADDISRLKLNSASSTYDRTFEYTSLTQKYKELNHCRFFQPSLELLSMLWEILLTKKCPSLSRIASLKLSGLGKLTS